MNRQWVLVAIAVLSCASVASVTEAQNVPVGQPQRGAVAQQSLPGTRIAMIDINRIFKSHERFKGAMENMKRNVEVAEEEVRKDNEAMKKLAEDLQGMHKGTPEYKAMEEELTRRETNLQVKLKMKKNELVQREAENYNLVYQEILQETTSFCQEYAIDMVVRINNEPVNVEQPNSVLGYINRQVVWNNPSLDITDQILSRLNSRGGAAAANPASANRAAAPNARQQVPFKQ
jgi:Skp family chaperone for outer membrane proteins